MTKRRTHDMAKRTRMSRFGAIMRTSGVNNEDNKCQQQHS